MRFNTVFRFHAILAFSYAVLMIFAPQFTMGLLTTQSLNPVGLDITKILGAAILFVGLMAWGASTLTDSAARRIIARGLLIYTSLGAIIALLGQIGGNWNVLGWSNVVVYLTVAIGYTYFLFITPE